MTIMNVDLRLIAIACMLAMHGAANAQKMSLPVEKGPAGQINVDVGVGSNAGAPAVDGAGMSFNNSGGVNGSAYVTPSRQTTVQGGNRALNLSVSTGPSGTTGSVGVTNGTVSGSVSSGANGPAVAVELRKSF